MAQVAVQLPEQESSGEEQGTRSAIWLMLAAGLAGVAVLCAMEPALLWAGLAIAVLLSLIAIMALRPRRIVLRDASDALVRTSDVLPEISAIDLARAVADPLIVFDRGGVVVHANPAAVAVFGAVLPGTMLQLRFRAPELQHLIEDALHGNDPGTVVDYVERLPLEQLYRVSVTLLDRTSGLSALVFRDQSEGRRIDRMRADFIANASHELRTPLASISGFIETLRGPAKNDVVARDRFLGIMQEQTGRMARLIDDLLSLSRVEMKPMLKPGETADLRPILERVIDTIDQRAREAGLKVVPNWGEDGFTVLGNKDELFQVFENLLENACKYGRDGGRVEVSLGRRDDAGEPGIAASIRDFGPGIAEEHIPRITERFYRVDVEASRSQKGTGLGLAIVKHIVTRHNARLLIRSQVGEGTEFTVFFPERKKLLE
ncbi:ATP-binding protein [Tianweitania sediminis]|jgi:two-component system phosphate regulon sensor histidine kinase PhoR|uniref:histidine kinase n=1 Tax=Tianweitania sediminis TaxID=1502156 RepID=A0A8J7R0W0_9HYPH|nr:ATP-binding protein [Tianweitania sediminis]MBP0438523.1 two-component sensor histidine kinase [Tianweitania sediminis]HEV7415669.1 ATP-binding protein [Tianweitania sediminis]